MSCSWVMVWIPTKALEKKNDLGIANIPSSKHRLRLFSDSSTITEGSEEELEQDDVNTTSNKSQQPIRGEGFSSNLSAETIHDTSPRSLEIGDGEKSDFFKYARSGSVIPLDPTAKCLTYETVLLEVLMSLNVSQAISQKSKDNNFVLVTFCVDNELLEEAIIRLGEHGIGNTTNTSISVLPTSVHVSLINEKEKK